MRQGKIKHCESCFDGEIMFYDGLDGDVDRYRIEGKGVMWLCLNHAEMYRMDGYEVEELK